MARFPQKGSGAVNKGVWTPEEDAKLVAYIKRHGIWNWSQMPKFAGLSRSGKSCRLRWLNYLSPHVKHGNFTEKEVETIINMYQKLGSRWSLIAKELPGRTDNEIKNYWHTRQKKCFMKKLVSRVPFPVVEIHSLEDIQENSHEIHKSSPFDNNIAEVSILEGHYSSNVLQAGHGAEISQVEIGFGEINIGNELCMEEQLIGFPDCEFNLPSWSLDSLSPSSCFYNDVYCDILFNFPERRGTTHFEEPFVWF